MKLPAEWAQPLLELIARESSFNPNAANPKSSAKGYFQFLDSTRNNYGGSKVNWNDPLAQTRAGIQYVIDRYSDPYKALKYWDEKGFY
jgi:SLT domain-containing protein